MHPVVLRSILTIRNSHLVESTNERIRRTFRAGYYLFLLTAITYSLFWFLKTLLIGVNPVPVHDQWTIFSFSERPLVDWFSARNSHPLFFPRIFYYLDIHLASGTGYLLTACSVIAQSMIVVLVLRLLDSGGIRTLGGRLTVASCILPIAFASVNFFNYIYGFMLHWFLSSLGFVVAVFTVASLSRSTSTRRDWPLVAIAVAASIISLLSMASGILAMPFAAVLVLVTPQKSRIRWFFAIEAMVGLVIYYFVYVLHGSPPPVRFTNVRLADAIVFVLTYVGAPVAHAINAGINLWANPNAVARGPSFLPILSMITGIGGVVAILWSLRAVWTYPSSPTRTSVLALLCIQSWVVVTSLLTYTARMQPGISAMAHQYWIMGILFWVTIPASVLLGLNSVSWKRVPGGPALSLFLLTLAIVGGQAGFYEWARGGRDSQYVAAVMLASGVHDQESLGLTFHPNDSPVERWQDVGWLREKRASFFSEDWLNGLGEKIEDRYPMTGAIHCDGNVLAVPTRIESGDHSGWRIDGWAANPMRRQPITHLILANSVKEIVGFGWGGRQPTKPSDVPARWRSQRVGWLGYASNSATGSITVYGELGSGSVCAVSEFVLPPDE